MQLSADYSFADTLTQAQQADKSVTLHLRSGIQIQGQVGAVSTHNVVIAEIVGREFYSAVVRLDDVSAIEVRTGDS